ncbi:MAG: transketolase, partial [Adhaeribacter sp.]
MAEPTSSQLPSMLDELSVNTIRLLAADMVQQANSGHPGLPLGAAPMAYVLWTRFLNFNPRDPHWENRDRFVLSAGHGSALLYSLLHLTGYDLPLEELRNFRQQGSRTPGHPESFQTPGVEVTTGPLGQGFGNGVGMAMAEAFLAARFNRPGFPVVDHYTYGIVSDGDLMEGVAAEAASLAGHLQLGKLIYLYDDNDISLDGPTRLAFTEKVVDRFAAYGWHTAQVNDGNDLEAIDRAIRQAQAEKTRPSLICVKTIIGFGSPQQGTSKVHGNPLGEENLRKSKEFFGWDPGLSFFVPEEVKIHLLEPGLRGAQRQAAWQDLAGAYRRD